MCKKIDSSEDDEFLLVTSRGGRGKQIATIEGRSEHLDSHHHEDAWDGHLHHENAANGFNKFERTRPVVIKKN